MKRSPYNPTPGLNLSALELLTVSTERYPDQTAVIDSLGSYTFSDLSRTSEKLSNRLRKLGVTPGSCIGISIETAGSFLCALFAIWSLDCVALSVPSNLSPIERERSLLETGTSWIIEGASFLSYESEPFCVHQLNPHGSASHKVRESFPEAAIIRYTSGTTGSAKGVVISHPAIFERTEISGQLLGLDSNDRLLTTLAISYHFVASALSCIRHGVTIIDCAPHSELLNSGAPSTKDLFTLIREQKPSVLLSDPHTYRLLNESSIERPLDFKPRLAIATSAVIDSQISADFRERYGVPVTQVYGIIELGLPIWNRGVASTERALLGRCMAPYEYRVVDDYLNDTPTGEPGELLLRGPGTFSGYILDGGAIIPNNTKEWFKTGDLVVMDHSGVLKYQGRKGSLIDLGLTRVAPEEIEAVLKEAPEVDTVRVLAEPHPKLGKVVVALVVLKDSRSDGLKNKVDLSAWRSLCLKGGLESFKIPHEFRIVNSIPKTGSGKIIRY